MAGIEMTPCLSQYGQQRPRIVMHKRKADICGWITATHLVFAAIAAFWGSFIWWVSADNTDLHYHHAIIGAVLYMLARFLIRVLKNPSTRISQFYILNRAYFPKSSGADIALLCTPIYLYMIYLSRRPGWGHNYETYTTVGQFINWMTLLSFVFSATAVSNLPKSSRYFDFGTLRVWVWTILGATVFTYLGSINDFDFAITSNAQIPSTAKSVFIAIIVVIGLLFVWWMFDMCKRTNTGSAWWLEGLGCIGLGVVINGLATYGTGDLKLVNNSSGSSIGANACGIAAIVVFAFVLTPHFLSLLCVKENKRAAQNVRPMPISRTQRSLRI